ncbi:MAG: YgiT-type zinc finger protein [Chloroflexi bacterium]|nr:YgiT-type zinc finger protein [Chloroflexota bacterium]
MEEKLTTFVYEEGGRVSVVRDVPAWVCKQCGEKDYSGQTTHQLLDSLKHPPLPSDITHVLAYEWAGVA